MSIFKLTKTYRNTNDVYYVKATETPCKDLLEEIGDATNGGHTYGYHIEAEEVERIPYGYFLLDRIQNIVDKYERMYGIV